MISSMDVSLSRGPTRILDGISLSVSPGEVAAIVGPSGGGKSTLLRCLNGLDRFQGGAVEVVGVRLDALATDGDRKAALAAIRRRLGMVFQGFHLFPHRTAMQNVAEGPIYVLKRRRDEAEAQARLLLERVGLAAKCDSRPSQLSGGQQQRVAIARALAMGPKAMLYDEPTSALDPRSTSEVLGVMAELARDGQTMVVVTHAMSFARRVAGVVHVVDGGRVIESGTPDEVLTRPQSEATRRFLDEIDLK